MYARPLTLAKLSGKILVPAILVTISLSVLSCKKNSHGEQEVIINLDKKGLEYINLQTGKYFIYKDSASGESDSVVVTKSSLESNHNPGRSGSNIFDNVPPYTYQSFNLVLTRLKPLPATEWFYGITLVPALIYNTDSSFIIFNERDNSSAFAYPLYYTNGSAIAKMTVEGKTYSDIIEFIYDNNYVVSDPLYKKTIYYWAKNTGIIKRVTISTGGASKVYTLLRSN
jgi:hypothetical protein